ncbi:glycosyltransferase family 4 protein [Mucilaginibacter sp.]
MKVLWVNPSFLDYRIPVYKKLFDLTHGNFFLIYSMKRVPERVVSKIIKAIGLNAIGLKGEIVLETKTKGDFANTGLRLPIQPGLLKAIAKVKADVIIAEGFFQWTPFALLIAKLFGKPFFIAYERTAHTERNCPKWRTFYRKVITWFVDGYLVNGLLTKEYLLGLGINSDKIFIGGMSADSENLVVRVKSLSDKENNQKILDPNDKVGLTYLYVGQLIERKGVTYLLKAWESHTKKYAFDNLLIVGTGPLLEEFVEEYSFCDSIKILGNVDYDLIHQYYAISDVFIIPTLEDNWSLVVPEAMACGLPIACSIYNGCYPELVKEGLNGKLFDPLNEGDILNVLKYFHDKDLESFGNNSIDIEKEYNADSVANKIFNSLSTKTSI